MENPGKPFILELNGVTMNVAELSIPGWVAFRVQFSSARKPIVIARALNANAERFWTSIPEGRQQEAEAIGKLIEEHLKK